LTLNSAPFAVTVFQSRKQTFFGVAKANPCGEPGAAKDNAVKNVLFYGVNLK